MTDSAFRYTQSKHARRLKSRQKRCHKQLYTKSTKGAVKGSNAQFKRSKASRAAVRKHWAKYNKKSKPRNVEQFDAFEAAQFLMDAPDGYDSPFSDCSSSCSSGASRAFQRKGLQFGRLAVYPCEVPKSPVVLKSQVRALLSRQFNSFDATYLLRPFAMDSFEGECRFWRHIMSQLGVVDELYAAQYLQKCHHDHHSNESYYTDFVEAIAAQMLPSAHLLYILDDVEAECRRDFDADFEFHAQKVVSGRGALVRLIDASSAWHIGRDLAALIAEFTMCSDDILARFHSQDCLYPSSRDVETKEYRIDGHRVTDILHNSVVKGKIFDGKDITAAYQLCDKTFEESQPLFHYGNKRDTVESL